VYTQGVGGVVKHHDPQVGVSSGRRANPAHGFLIVALTTHVHHQGQGRRRSRNGMWAQVGAQERVGTLDDQLLCDPERDASEPYVTLY
jgi:hypothetical protein